MRALWRVRGDVIVTVADTHREAGHGLDGRLLEAVRAATVVIHAGDFTTGAVLDAFEAEARRLEAVAGNGDDAAVRDRLPDVRTVEAEGARFVVAHGHEHGETALSLLGRQERADVVVVGHSHRPAVVETEGPTLVNPGSHARPRGFRPGYATFEPADGGVEGHLRGLDGSVVESFRVR